MQETQILRQSRLPVQKFPGSGVLQGEQIGVEGLPAELRQVIDNASGLAGSELAGAAWDKAGAAARQKAQDRGNEVFVLPENEVARWRQAPQPVTDAWVAAGPDRAALLDAAKALIAKHTA